MNQITKYPRTAHLMGSRIQDGDEDISVVPVAELRGKHVVVEEKCDGANSGISYDHEWNQMLQSRGHYLTGGPREVQFNLFKQWAAVHNEALLDRLMDRYILYAEWMYNKHTVFYDMLPHYLLTYDVLDTSHGTYLDPYGNECKGTWLSTPARADLLKGLPVVPVHVVHEGDVDSVEQLESMITRSAYISDSRMDVIKTTCEATGQDIDRILRETDATGISEGLYLKVEDDDRTIGRYKFVRPGFIQSIMFAGTHHLDRPLFPNRLAPGVDIFAGACP
jgi:hypothetical protein